MPRGDDPHAVFDRTQPVVRARGSEPAELERRVERATTAPHGGAARGARVAVRVGIADVPDMERAVIALVRAHEALDLSADRDAATAGCAVQIATARQRHAGPRWGRPVDGARLHRTRHARTRAGRAHGAVHDAHLVGGAAHLAAVHAERDDPLGRSVGDGRVRAAVGPTGGGVEAVVRDPTGASADEQREPAGDRRLYSIRPHRIRFSRQRRGVQRDRPAV